MPIEVMRRYACGASMLVTFSTSGVPTSSNTLTKDQRRAREVARHREREHDAPEQPQAARAEVLRRFLHRAVDVGERDGEVEQDEREIVQRLDEDDAVEPVHERHGEAERSR